MPLVEHIYEEKGIVSLVEMDSQSVIAGTKRGSLEEFLWDPRTQALQHKQTITSCTSTIPNPIYSLLHRRDKLEQPTHQLFCGGADRYITVWEQKDKWSIVQRLGPHTGWVKSLALDASSQRQLLHSIGCNCIETWEREGADEWKHKKKRTIESSPDLGATLSSDLLCLAQWQDWLLSGGVDGRIHLWSSDPGASLQPLQSISAHNGPVHALVLIPTADSKVCQLFSTGHDGILQGRLLQGNEVDNEGTNALSETPNGSFILLDGLGRTVRITAMTCTLCEESKGVSVLLGTTSGRLAEVIVTADDDTWSCCDMKQVSLLQVVPESTVHALLKVGNKVIVGHSQGLALITLAPP